MIVSRASDIVEHITHVDCVANQNNMSAEQDATTAPASLETKDVAVDSVDQSAASADKETTVVDGEYMLCMRKSYCRVGG